MPGAGRRGASAVGDRKGPRKPRRSRAALWCPRGLWAPTPLSSFSARPLEPSGSPGVPAGSFGGCPLSLGAGMVGSFCPDTHSLPPLLPQGCVPTMARAVVVNAAQLASYSQSKQFLLDSGKLGGN